MILEFIEETALRRDMARSILQHPPDVRGERRISSAGISSSSKRLLLAASVA
jgi:hypothetical protein